MNKATNFLLLALVTVFMTGCSWTVNLVVANNSDHDITVTYAFPAGDEDSQFFRDPKTYRYDDELRKLNKRSEHKRPLNIPTNMRVITEKDAVEVTLAPGQAVHVGVYYSFQPRLEILSKYNLSVSIDKDSTMLPATANNMFRHWKSIRIDLLEVVK